MHKKCHWRTIPALMGGAIIVFSASPCWAVADRTASSAPAREELAVTRSDIGSRGGTLNVTERSEPKTLNPVSAIDSVSAAVVQLMMADLIHIDRHSLGTEPALAKSWRVSGDGRVYTLELRRGLRFSDGRPFDADDVVFSFAVYLDEKVNSPHRDLLIVGGKPLQVTKLGPFTVQFELAQPYAAAERLFDSVAILPRHLLESAYREGKFVQSWGLSTPPSQIAGLGPFRLKAYVPGMRLVLERNPYYWKSDRAGSRLPYLDQICFSFVPSQDAQTIRFQVGDSDMAAGLSSEDYSVLEREQRSRGYRLYDLGPGLEFNFLFFNLNDLDAKSLPQVAQHQNWFRDLSFRQAVSAAIDRDSIVRLVYRGRGTPLWGPETPGDKLWADASLPREPRSLDRARQLLKSAGFTWRDNGTLVDRSGTPVEFTIISSSSNTQRTQMATLIASDLGDLGMRVNVVPLEFRALLDRILQSHDYDACVLGLASGDTDPNGALNVWVSNGGTHLWHTGETKPATAWETEIDSLMQQQLGVLDYRRRKALYDRVQRLVADNLPIICLASPDILVGAKSGLGNFKPAILNPYTLWNAEELFWQPSPSRQVSEIVKSP